jgi:S-methylmethionine-dependent homocysteine/selenocysteine methylase
LELLSINKELWDIEDDIRDKERVKEFDEDFVKLARSVYYTNDVRAKIKKENITDPVKLDNIVKEYDYLLFIVENNLEISTESPEYLELLSINQELWVIEDDIRDKERIKEFDDDFIKLARSVYYTNDVRAKIKKEINLKYSSGFVEEKSYQSY